MKLRTERGYPAAIGAIAGVACWAWLYHSHWQPPDTIRDLFPAIINVAAIAVGFLSASLAILFTIIETPMMRQLRDVGYLKFVVRYMMSGMIWCVVLALLSGAAVLIGTSPSVKHYYLFVLPPWAGVLTATALAYFRVIRIFSTILISHDLDQVTGS